ncbi:MAG: hypothetical protein HY765_05375 [Rhodomicrobium sp.]|nr:hypothetical protein [Rhodomicrobium sp.]
MKKSAQAFSVAIIGIVALDCTIAVQARAECYVKAPLRPVHRTYIQRDVVEPGVYEVNRAPSVYGWTSNGDVPRRILLRPYKNIARFQRPYIAWQREHLTIQPEGYRWRRIPAQPDC